MTSIVYGVVDAARVDEGPLPAEWGDPAIEAVRSGKVAALLAPISEEAGRAASVDRALAFARVVEGLHRRMTILPMRFGSLVRRPDDAAEFLRLHEGELADALAAVKGCEEMGLRVLIRGETEEKTAAPEGGSSRTGTAYLEARRRYYEGRKRVERVCQEWADRLEEAFGGLYREVRREHAPSSEGEVLSLSFLVERPRVDAFRRMCRSLREETSTPVICSGPWPPFSFVPDLVQPTEKTQL